MKNQNKLIYLDYMKAICIIMVVLLHSIGWGSRYYGVSSVFGNIIWDFCHQVSRSLFFIISGYLCHKQDIKKFYSKRFKALIIPYWFFASIKLIYSIFIDGQYKHADSILMQIYDAFILGRLYWFPYALFIINLLMPLLWVDESNMKLKEKPSIITVITMVLIIINFVLSINGIKYDTNTIPFQLSSVLEFLPYFLVGYLLKYENNFFNTFINSNKQRAMFIGSTLVILVVLYINSTTDLLSNYLISLVFCLCSSYFIYVISNNIKKDNRCLLLISKYTLQIHFIDPFLKVMLFTIISNIINMNLVFVIIIAILNITIGVIISTVLEEMPFIRKLVGL